MTRPIPVYLARNGNAVLKLADGQTLNLTRHTAIQLAMDLASLNRLKVVPREQGDPPDQHAREVTGHTDDCIPALGPDFCAGHE